MSRNKDPKNMTTMANCLHLFCFVRGIFLITLKDKNVFGHIRNWKAKKSRKSSSVSQLCCPFLCSLYAYVVSIKQLPYLAADSPSILSLTIMSSTMRWDLYCRLENLHHDAVHCFFKKTNQNKRCWLIWTYSTVITW